MWAYLQIICKLSLSLMNCKVSLSFINCKVSLSLIDYKVSLLFVNCKVSLSLIDCNGSLPFINRKMNLSEKLQDEPAFYKHQGESVFNRLQGEPAMGARLSRHRAGMYGSLFYIAVWNSVDRIHHQLNAARLLGSRNPLQISIILMFHGNRLRASLSLDRSTLQICLISPYTYGAWKKKKKRLRDFNVVKGFINTSMKELRMANRRHSEVVGF